MMHSSLSIFKKGGFSRFQAAEVKLGLIVYLISFIAASLSLIFILAILFVSSLTVKKRKRLVSMEDARSALFSIIPLPRKYCHTSCSSSPS
jgi:hypothetical protein